MHSQENQIVTHEKPLEEIINIKKYRKNEKQTQSNEATVTRLANRWWIYQRKLSYLKSVPSNTAGFQSVHDQWIDDVVHAGGSQWALVNNERRQYLLGKSSLPTPKEDNHGRGDDYLHRGRERDTRRKNPLKTVNRKNMT